MSPNRWEANRITTSVLLDPAKTRIHLFATLCGYNKMYRPISKHWCKHWKKNVFQHHKWIPYFFHQPLLRK